MCNSIKHDSERRSSFVDVGAAESIRTLHKSLPPNKICALNRQIILIINLLPKQLVINYNLMMNYLVLTAWGKRCNQTLIIHWVIKFIGASPSLTHLTLSLKGEV